MTQETTNRIYQKNVEVDEEKIQDFWNNRAKKYQEDAPYVSVKLSDNNTQYSEQWNQYESETILPLLGIQSNSRVLDIGCGMGRLSEAIIPQCGYYVGVDYADELLEIAKKRNSVRETVRFVSASFQEVNRAVSQETDLPFDCVIIAGVCQYINDEELKTCFHNLLPLLSKNCRIYFSNAVATEQRLTLKEFYSEELESNYSSIYRTSEEYFELVQEILDCGFTVETSGYFDRFQKFKETQRYYLILHRTEKSEQP